jgi:hypothetical protein
MFYIDDLAHTISIDLQRLQADSLKANKSEHPVLQRLLQILEDMYEFWEQVPANCINIATFEFINGCILEGHPDLQDIAPGNSTASWPYYLREKTGVAAAYGFMIFVKDTHTSVSHFVRVMPDVCLFINLTNDVLS